MAVQVPSLNSSRVFTFKRTSAPVAMLTTSSESKPLTTTEPPLKFESSGSVRLMSRSMIDAAWFSLTVLGDVTPESVAASFTGLTLIVAELPLAPAA